MVVQYFTMRKIALTKGYSALVDEMDFEVLSRWKWQYASGYAVHSTHASGHSVQLKMHRFLTEAKRGEIVDHIDGDRLNNCRANLRIVSSSVNAQNRMNEAHLENFKGVYFCRQKEKYVSSITVNGHKKTLGYFDDPIQAALAYDVAAVEWFGKDAATNAKILAMKLRKK